MANPIRKQTWIILFVLLSGCNACLNQFYGTNSHEYLDISFEDSSLTYLQRTYYIDSVLNKGTHFPDSVKSKFYISDVQTDLNGADRLIHFKGPEEWYLVELLGEGQTEIEAIYNPEIADHGVFDKRYLSEGQLARIRNRMQTEVLNKMAAYAWKKAP